MMMVKNEEAVIGRAIWSAISKVNVDSVIVVDTGSTDETREVAREATQRQPMTPVALRWFEMEWRDFGWNRTAALNVARATLPEGADLKNTYFLLLDADDEIASFPDKMSIPEDAEVLTATNIFGPMKYPQIRMVRADVGLTWVGKTHEYLACTEGRDAVLRHLDGFVYVLGTDSSRRKSGNKAPEDIELLKQEILEDPDNTRARFYLGNSYWDLKQYEDAIAEFRDCIDAHRRNPGFDEELYLSAVRAGDCALHLGLTDEAILLWLEAINERPHRPESYACLAKCYQALNRNVLAFKFASDGAVANPGNDRLFVDYGARQLCRDIRDQIADAQINSKQAS